jgi:replication-associated recombination protein RarA
MDVDIIMTDDSKHNRDTPISYPIREEKEINHLQDILRIRSPHPISSFSELLKIVNKIQSYPERNLSPEFHRLKSMSNALYDLDSMVGQNNVKETLLRLILFCAQNLHQNSSDMMNVCIYAPPGAGKTKLTQIIADIFYYSGLLKKTPYNQKERFIRGTRATLISGYLGQTAILTQKVINQCITEGKCLLIDEVYSLHNPERRDSFSKECIDTINQNLSEYPNTFRLIIAGYKQETEECFFKTNRGLSRRFGFTYELDTYSASELREIFFQQIAKCGYDVENIWSVATEKWFLEHKSDFTFAGGDIENIAKYARLRSSQRCFGLPKILKNRINQKDLIGALEDLKLNRSEKNEDFPHHLYM